MGSSAVLYHYPCPDGAFAALAAHLYFSALRRPVSFYPNTVYNPIKVEDLPIEDFEVIYLLDFVGPNGFVSTLCSKDKRVVILDHHKTAMEMLQANEFDHKNCVKVIDMNRSGATIAHDYFTERLLSEKVGFAMVSMKENLPKSSSLVPEKDMQRVGLLYKYVEDADLWRWILPDSKAFSSGLKDMQIELSYKQNQRLFEQLLALDPRSIIEKGRDSLSHKQKLIDEALEQSYEISLGNGKFGNCLIIALKNQVKDIKMNKGETIQAYFLRMTKIKNQLSTISEVVPSKQMVFIALGGLFPIWETFIITMNNIKTIPTFDELLGKCIQGEARMIFRGRISHHEEGELTKFSAYDKREATEAGNISHLRSDIGNQLASKSLDLNLRPIGAVVYNVEELANNDIVKISLRSIGSEDTTEISQAYGGGGHRNASSFMINRKEFMKWKV